MPKVASNSGTPAFLGAVMLTSAVVVAAPLAPALKGPVKEIVVVFLGAQLSPLPPIVPAPLAKYQSSS